MKAQRIFPFLFVTLCLIIIFFNFSQAFRQNIGSFTRFDYWSRFKSLENLYNSSQYIQKHPKAIVTDDVVYAFNAGRFIQGVNPILVNPEVPPLGKYIIGASILIFNNESIINLIASIFCFPLLFILSYQVFRNSMLAIIPPLLFSFEKMFVIQLLITPTLDIFQLDFLLASFIIFLLAFSRKKNYLWMLVVSAFFLGCFISTKFFASGFVIAATYTATTFLIARQKLVKLILCLLIAPLVLLASYSKLFFLGYSLREVLGVQKWIFLYNTGHLGNPPFTVWDLILFNRWHTWWAGNHIITDSQWNILWPIALIISLVTILILGKESITKKRPVTLIMVWVLLYLTFLNVGQITSRYFFILLPFLYILAVQGSSRMFLHIFPKMKKKFFSHIIFLFLVGFCILIPCFTQAKAEGQTVKSSYVLPYPGFMPGNKLYKVYTLFDIIEKYYSFGDFAQFSYNLSKSDKYLVEAKTLFEYNQYPLALAALQRSDHYFKNTYPNLMIAKKHGKDISDKIQALNSASQKHQEVLLGIMSLVPRTFVWQDEKKLPITLYIHDAIQKSIKIRQAYE